MAFQALADQRCPGDIDFRASVSLIDEKSGRRVRMGQLAFVGSHRINGVSAMHSDLMKETVFHDLHHLYPSRITNKTNGITFRRWLMLANPKLTALLREVCGDAVLDDFSLLSRIEAEAGDNAFQQRFRDVKHHNKLALARLIAERNHIKVDPSALFDVQIKRIHEYKRQLLNIIETVALYHAMKDEPQRDWVPRVKIFSGKAAASQVTTVPTTALAPGTVTVDVLNTVKIGGLAAKGAADLEAVGFKIGKIGDGTGAKANTVFYATGSKAQADLVASKISPVPAVKEDPTLAGGKVVVKLVGELNVPEAANATPSAGGATNVTTPASTVPTSGAGTVTPEKTLGLNIGDPPAGVSCG